MITKTLRITTGTAKNKRLQAPNIEGFRAVQEIAKGAIFAIMEDKVVGAVCLDLYAGSGNLGLEALSRGAKQCDFVDEHPDAIRAVNENILNCGFTQPEITTSDDGTTSTTSNYQAATIRKNSLKYVENCAAVSKKYDIIFLDPFYQDTAQTHMFKFLPLILNPNGLIIYLYGEDTKLDKIIGGNNLRLVTTRKFGKSHFSVFTA